MDGSVQQNTGLVLTGYGDAPVQEYSGWKEYLNQGDIPTPNQALEAILKGSQHHKKGRPEKLLCDMMTDPRLYRLKHYKDLRVKTPIPHQIREYEKIVLDDEAIRMGLMLANSTPLQILHMLDVALPPSKKTWIEWSSRAALNTLRESQDLGLSIPTAPEAFATERAAWARCGVMIETTDQAYLITCIESGEQENQIWEWPVRFAIAKGSDQKIKPLELNIDAEKVTITGKGSQTEQAAVVWGYTPKFKGLSNLSRKGSLHIPPHMTMLITAMAGGTVNDNAHQIIRHTANELSGLTRQVVAILAMLHTSMEISDPVRPKGQFMIKGGQPKAYSERRVARLLVPGRVRNTEGYVRDRIKDEGEKIRRRRHKVKAHFRHSQFLPLNGEGWVRCYCPGREPGKLWHKKIDEHYRGDAELGFVTHDYTLVSGPDQGE